MKKTFRTTVSVIVIALLTIMLAACAAGKKDDLWQSATYTQDTVLGEGDTTVTVEVKAGERSVTFTINTDDEILGDALLDNGLIDGEEGEFGMYIKEVDGMTADYDVDQSYWAFSKDGEYMMTGVDGTKIADGDHFELTYAK